LHSQFCEAEKSDNLRDNYICPPAFAGGNRNPA
jgi:hypothetical protein